MRRTYMRCPGCKKKGVTLRLRNNGEDHYGCRYCDWFAFTSEEYRSDVERRRLLYAINPIKPLRGAHVD